MAFGTSSASTVMVSFCFIARPGRLPSGKYTYTCVVDRLQHQGNGGVVTKAKVPIKNLYLSDIVNSAGSYAHENEVVFKGVESLDMEVTKTI